MAENAVVPFAFLGGALCLDFANTAFRDNGVVVLESLGSSDDLLSWGVAAQLFAPADADRLRMAAGVRREEVRDSFGRAVTFREQVYRIFAAVAERHGVDPHDLAALDRAQSDAFARRRLVAEGTEFRWDWSGGSAALDQVLWRVTESATDLLTQGELSRVRRCAGENCTRLFLDTSRSGQRRWCDMNHCGNIAKARRFRALHANGTRGPQG